MENAIDCKTEYSLNVIADCEVGGVRYAAGQSIRTESKSSADYLVAQGAAVFTGGTVAAEDTLPPVHQVQAARIKRR